MFLFSQVPMLYFGTVLFWNILTLVEIKHVEVLGSEESRTKRERGGGWSNFQRQLRILQNSINSYDALCDNFPQGLAETSLQTDISCSYVLYDIIAKYVPFQRYFYNN